MAASITERRRQKSCDVRPVYRETRRPTAVKVYTINQESRYLLIHGVPDIQVNDELLKLLSLYGSIEEYKILDDYPCEAFTKVYWIKYKDIHAARVSKRKMDNRSFYGGSLDVAYAPEYETTDDTRSKLQGRRMDVANRLRKLQQEKDFEESLIAVGHRGAVPVTQLETNTASLMQPTTSPKAPDPMLDSQQYLYSAEKTSDCQDLALLLPVPPKTLPPWHWDSPAPSLDEYSRLPTAHATLPKDFNPYPDSYQTKQPSITIHRQRTDVTPAIIQTNSLALAAQHSMAKGCGTGVNAAAAAAAATGARPKLTPKKRLGSNTMGPSSQQRFLDRIAWQGTDNNREEKNSFKQPRPDRPHPDELEPDRTHLNKISTTQTFVPRQLLGKRKHTMCPSQLGVGSHGADHSEVTLPATGDTSFDRTVQEIRSQMRRVSSEADRRDNETRSLQPPPLQPRQPRQLPLPPRPPPHQEAAAEDDDTETKRRRI